MTIENEKPKRVTNQQLLTAIELTRKEKETYEKLADGYWTLSELPENQGSGSANLHFVRYLEFAGLAEQCGRLLEKLLALKVLRGIKK